MSGDETSNYQDSRQQSEDSSQGNNTNLTLSNMMWMALDGAVSGQVFYWTVINYRLWHFTGRNMQASSLSQQGYADRRPRGGDG